MKGLLLRNGDLVIGRGGYAEVTGQAKVVQDLGVTVQEDFGLDRFHPRYGSLLDRYIGLPADAGTQQLVKSEITRVLQNYILLQQDQIAADALVGRSPRYSADEVIIGMPTLDVQQSFDSFRVVVTLSFGNGTTVVVSTSQAV